MKKLTLLVIAFFTMTFTYAQTQEIQRQDALTVAQSFLETRTFTAEISSVEKFTDDKNCLAWLINLSPQGFILVAHQKPQAYHCLFFRKQLAYRGRGRTDFYKFDES